MVPVNAVSDNINQGVAVAVNTGVNPRSSRSMVDDAAPIQLMIDTPEVTTDIFGKKKAPKVAHTAA